jgi:hypothetical protein
MGGHQHRIHEGFCPFFWQRCRSTENTAGRQEFTEGLAALLYVTFATLSGTLNAFGIFMIGILVFTHGPGLRRKMPISSRLWQATNQNARVSNLHPAVTTMLRVRSSVIIASASECYKATGEQRNHGPLTRVPWTVVMPADAGVGLPSR